MEKHLNVNILPNRSLQLEWVETANKISKVQKLFENKIDKIFAKDTVSGLFQLGLSDKAVILSPSMEFWRSFAHEFTEKLRLTPDIENLRDKIYIEIEPGFLLEFCLKSPFAQGAEYINQSLLAEYWEKLNIFFQTGIKSFKGNVEDFFHQYSPNVHLIGHIYFHLVENKGDEENPFAFLATYASGVSKQGKSKHRPLKYALIEYENDRTKLLELLSTVHAAAQSSPVIKQLLDNGELFHPLKWETREAFNFLQDVALYEEAGILCRIPNWWRKKNANRVQLSITVGGKPPSYIGMDSLLDFQADLVLDGEPISLKDVKDILNQSDGLAYLKGKWVNVDRDQLQATLSSWEQAQKLMEEQEISLAEAFQLLRAPGNLKQLGISGDEEVEVTCGEWLGSLLKKMRNPEIVKSVNVGKEFKGNLRPYQQTGLNWLSLLESFKFGGCLADDMGLGKTIQVLAFLTILSKRKSKLPANLLVIPASLIFNWISEIKKFAPALKVSVAHPGAEESKILKTDDTGEINKFDMIITTYGFVKRHDWIREHVWNYVILDEAQAIKNTGTAQTKAVKKLKCTNRLALTGTPIENRLADLWSLFDFLNPGLLGSRKEFTEFCKGMSGESSDYSNLRQVISPYILRRLKTDKNIISDLPEKIELNTYSNLSKKQIILYKKLVEELKKTLETTEGIQKRGMILASLMKFKQICNHPDQYLGVDGYSESESGKFGRLREICETIYEKREKVLIFTQFREITEALSNFLSNVFNAAGLVLHGGTAVKKRGTIVERFQSNEYVPYIVLSIKAGGVGLNLTAANHVIHFDRWWNPAVENQATDRAFRIGQKKSVVVHKFITQGTIEEKIAQMLEDKSRLSRDVIEGASENWITEMDDKKIIDMFKFDSTGL